MTLALGGAQMAAISFDQITMVTPVVSPGGIIQLTVAVSGGEGLDQLVDQATGIRYRIFVSDSRVYIEEV